MVKTLSPEVCLRTSSRGDLPFDAAGVSKSGVTLILGQEHHREEVLRLRAWAEEAGHRGSES